MDISKTGIDVSKWQADINWKTVKSATNPPIEYALIKATEGVQTKDSKAQQNGLGAKTAGIKFGYYHFARPYLDNAIKSAQWFAASLKSLPKGEIMPVLDLETNDGGLTPAQMQEWVTTFLNTMKSLGYPDVIMYSYKYFLNDNLPKDHPFGNMPLWLASYTNNPPTPPNGWDGYEIWQYTDKGQVPGITGNVDMNKSDNLAPVLLGISSIIIVGTIALLLFAAK